MTTPIRFFAAALILIGLGNSAGAQDPHPGLSLTFTSDSASSTVVAPNVWLFVKTNETPNPFLAPGKFTATWRGFVSVELRSIYSFQARLNGSLKLEINGKPVMDVSSVGELSEISKRVRLSKGPNELVATYTPADDGDTMIKLLWIPRKTYAQPIPQRLLTHLTNNDIDTSAQLHRGRELMLEHRCLHCHKAEGTTLPELAMDAPAFDGIGSRRKPSWLAEWIANPKAHRPSARMPALFHGPDAAQDAEAIANYLATLTAAGESTPPPPRDDAAIAAGRKLFTTLNCTACHNPLDAAVPDESKSSLGQVARKFNPGALVAFLQKPSKHYQWIRMPDFRLSIEEANQIAAFLLSDVRPAETLSTVKGTVNRGRQLVQTRGCLNCHTGPVDNEFQATELAGLADWETGCLAIDAVDGSPHFNFQTTDRSALIKFASTSFDSLERHVDSEFAARQVTRLNCKGCHNHRMDLVPHLSLLGGKIKPEYGARIIAGQIEEKPRPWIPARMPGFAEIPAKGIARGLANIHGFPAETPQSAPADSAMGEVGLKLVSADGGFSCVSCHGIGEAGVTQVFESPGINLATGYERLQHDYFTRWMLNPLLVDPTSKMPVFFDEEARSPLFEIYDGDGRKQVEALWQYIRPGKDMSPPEGMEVNAGSGPVSFERLE